MLSTASNSSLKQSCSALTSVTSALAVIFNIMRSINPRFTYLLTYSLDVAFASAYILLHLHMCANYPSVVFLFCIRVIPVSLSLVN